MCPPTYNVNSATYRTKALMVHTTSISVMIIIAGASLSEQHTDLLICRCTKQDSSRTSRYLDITYDKPTARTATVNVSTYARTKLYTKVISCISDVISAVYADGPYLKRP